MDYEKLYFDRIIEIIMRLKIEIGYGQKLCLCSEFSENIANILHHQMDLKIVNLTSCLKGNST